MDTIQGALFHFTYHGHPCFKNPFDLALYTLLLDRERPRTIIEIGSAGGGSALWFAGQMRSHGVDAQVISLDLIRQRGVKESGVQFIKGDALDLAASPLPALLERAERPFLVVDDGAHTYDTVLASLEFFRPYLRSGEYMVVEDGVVADLGLRSYEDGPNRAMDEFMRRHPGEFVVDRSYCDFYGHNVTWATNGFLRRV
jgi:cephalosporin hydroxylase